MPRKTCYIHIGTGKTGTTSIQGFMAKNRAALSRRGVCYPLLPNFQSAHHGLVIDNCENVLDAASREQAWHQLMRDISATECHKVIISSERFASNESLPDELGKLLHGYSVKIICYLRRADSHLSSLYTQWLKIGDMHHDTATFLKKHSVSYLQLLNRWAEVFGDESIRVVPFEKSSLKPSLIHTFFYACDEEIHPEYMTPERQNVSPSGEVIKLLMLSAGLARAGALDEAAYKKAQQFLQEIQVGEQNKKFNPFTPEQQREILKSHAEEYDEISRRFLGGEPLFRDPEVIDEDGGNLSLAPETLVAIDLHLYDQMETRMKRLEQKLFRKKVSRFFKSLFGK